MESFRLGNRIAHRLVHSVDDTDRGVVIYDPPRLPPWMPRWLGVLLRIPWTKRTQNCDYHEPILIVDRNGIKTNPDWVRDKAYPILDRSGEDRRAGLSERMRYVTAD